MPFIESSVKEIQILLAHRVRQRRLEKNITQTLLKICLQLTQNMTEVEQLIKRMIFNVLIENKDDHAKNFAFQYIHHCWKLSPAFDILPNNGFNGNHTTTVNGKGNPDKEDLRKVATNVGFSGVAFEKIYKDIFETINSSK